MINYLFMTPQELMSRLAVCLKNGETVAQATVTGVKGSVPREIGAKMLVFPDGRSAGTIGGGRLEAQTIEDARKALRDGRCRQARYDLEPQSLGMYCEGSVEVFIDVFCDSLKLVILGGGHVGQKTGALASFLGVPYSVVDDREEFVSAERFPYARKVLQGAPSEALKALAVDEKTAIIIVTRCHGFDLRCLVAALSTPAFYIGMIGSRAKTRRLFDLCQRRGLSPETDTRVFAPIGLDLGGRAPEAIALSILAEIFKVKNKASAHSLKEIDAGLSLSRG